MLVCQRCSLPHILHPSIHLLIMSDRDFPRDFSFFDGRWSTVLSRSQSRSCRFSSLVDHSRTFTKPKMKVSFECEFENMKKTIVREAVSQEREAAWSRERLLGQDLVKREAVRCQRGGKSLSSLVWRVSSLERVSDVCRNVECVNVCSVCSARLSLQRQATLSPSWLLITDYWPLSYSTCNPTDLSHLFNHSLL